MIEQAITTILEGTSAITDIVGSSSPRIYWNHAPLNHSLPAIVIHRISTTGRDLHHSGTIGGARATFQFTCLAKKALAAKQLKEAVRVALHGYKGTTSGVRIFIAQAIGEVDLYDEVLGASVALDVLFVHAE